MDYGFLYEGNEGREWSSQELVVRDVQEGGIWRLLYYCSYSWVKVLSGSLVPGVHEQLPVLTKLKVRLKSQ